MNLTNPQTIKTKSKEAVLGRIYNLPSSREVTKPEAKKSAYACESETKNCVNSSNVPRPALTTSNSFKETLKSDRLKGEIKQTPSMIPRSKSRKRTQNVKVKSDASPKTEKVDKSFESRNKKSKSHLVGVESQQVVFPNEILGRSSALSNGKRQSSAKKLVNVSSAGPRNFRDSFEVSREESNALDVVAQEPSSNYTQTTRGLIKGRERIKPSTRIRSEEGKITYQGEAQRQENTIQCLYDTIKHTVGPLFDKFRWTCAEDIGKNFEKELDSQSETGSCMPNAQEHYEFTLREISDIWKNTISLIRSVKDHTLEFVDKKNPSFDKEQLTLEAEMLQLAVDFAINYSKLKTDFFIKWLSGSLNVGALEKTELENFMDSKTFSSFYNSDDLDTMAQTVEDLNASVLKGEDFELD